MKKAFDQTVRDLKRGVNKTVLKVPRVEQKILDATSNEPWGPHGSLLADIAQATRNYHDYQLIINVIWKRINDTGKNWRHVYKALTVLDYLVAHGSERVIDDIREHSYQIGTLADFQYIDSSGRDQGQNVRRKSQSLVSLVNNKERIQEVRQKAAANREKYRSSISTGGGNRGGSYPGPGGYGDDDNAYGRERDRDFYRDDDRYGRGGTDPYSRDARDYDDNYTARESSYRDKDDSRNSNYSDGYSYGGPSRARNSFDRDRDRPYDDDDRYSTRSAGGGRADDDDRRIERKLSEPNIASASSPPAPPSYEDAVKDSPLPSHEDRDGENGPATVAPKAESIPAPASISAPVSIPAPTPAVAPAAVPVQSPTPEPLPTQSSTPVDGFDEFDPRGPFSATPFGDPSASAPAPAASAVSSLEMDFFGSDPIGSLALVPMTTTTTTDDHAASINSGFDANSFASMSAPAAASSPFDQVGNNPFGDAPFKALPQDDNFGVPPNIPPITASGSSSFQALSAEPAPAPAPRMETVPSFNFGDAFGDMNFNSTPSGNGDVLGAASFLPTTTMTVAGVPTSTSSAPAQISQPHVASTSTPFGSMQQNQFAPGGFAQTNQFTAQVPNSAFPIQHQQGFLAPQAPTATTAFVNPAGPFQAAQPQSTTAFMNQTPVSSGSNFGMPSQPGNQSTLFAFESSASQTGVRPQSWPAPLPQSATQPQSGKFETKSSVWNDTLSRGLVNLNISGPKTNPHADIGVDFDTMNRKDKRDEKKSAAPAVVSTVTMGKAMGSGSGIGRAGAGGIAAPRNPMAGSGMGMGMGTGMGMGSGNGMGMPMGGAGSGGGYGGMNQPTGMGGMGAGMGMGGMGGMGMGGMGGMGMGGGGMGGMGMGGGMGGMGMGGGAQGMPMRPMGGGMGMGGGAQGMPMRPMGGIQPGAPGMGYNPMMGPGNGFGSQQPYGGGGFR